MNRTGLIVAGLVATGIVALFLIAHSPSSPAPSTGESGASRNKIAQKLPPELRTESSPAVDVPPPAGIPSAKPMFPAPTSEDVEKFAARNADAISRAKQRETDQLLAAGFSLERIAWIRDRTAELLAEQTRAAAERKEKGLRNDDPYSLRYLIDSDLDLRKAMSDEEYARYRSATGRTTAVPVTGVAPGSNGESAGLQTGDEIVAYDGKRVFNYYDLEKAASEAGSVEVLVDVLRDGKKLQLAMPAGSVGISQQSWAEMQLNNRPCSASLMKLPPELRNKVCNPRTPAAPGSQDPEGPQLLPRSSGDN